MTIEDFIKLIRPKYYNRLTRLLVVSGIALLSKPVWLDILNLFLGGLKLSIIGEFDWLLGLVIIIIALIYNTYHRKLDLEHESKSKPAFQEVQYIKFTYFGNLCQEILPILKDNEYIFLNTGPTCSNDLGPLRTDLTVWEKLKKKAILPNNKAIKKLIKNNFQLVPEKYGALFNKMLLHIDAFKKHVKNPNFDYSEFQFPKQFAEVIFAESFEYAKTNKNLVKKHEWIRKNINEKYVLDWIIFGSIVFTPEKASDLDLAILMHEENDFDQLSTYIEGLKFDFKIKFKKDLHVSIFENTEVLDFISFSEKNPLKIKK
ncbi:hypothetical protein GON26_07470 [Flavobacterium sp. GA093]|uniref:Uncharacterized protein n=1 Tax=Flavobacterium hydrocarbonoxydans TaxID=2683249 RepID=A0A6I4NSX5_9FLAO|nr:hypothetical protein [Flavobacterium hydrocarbonoxydans]MWB94197.1 hypothetical protein [Flavobacterium hydrocarbonoxydans]